MDHQRRTKKVIVFEELSKRIVNGQFQPGSDFLTVGELMRRYTISAGTAGKVLAELKQRGLLEGARGHKSKVAAAEPPCRRYPLLDKPVGLISPLSGPYRTARWRDMMMFDLQRHLIAHGNQALWYSELIPREKIRENFAGVIYAGELAPPDPWSYLMQNNIPCVRISFERPYRNTVFNDYRVVMDQVALHIFRAGCSRIVYLVSSEVEAGGVKRWLARIRVDELLAEYGFAERNFRVRNLQPEQSRDVREFRAEELSSSEKVAYLTNSSENNQFLAEELAAFGKVAGVDYELYTLSSFPGEIQLGHSVDMKPELMIEKILDMFYRQCLTGKQQVGEVVLPEFIPGHPPFQA